MGVDEQRDETVRLVPRRAGAGWLRGAWLAAVAVLVAGGIGVGIGLWLPHPGQRPAPVAHPPSAPAVTGPQVVAPSPPTPLFAIRTAGEAEILADEPDRLTVFRFAANPRILVLDFPSLRQQGLMLNRVAALIEKSGEPRDRVLGDAELDAAIRAAGETIETYYWGHDYRAADLARFFALADRDHVVLTPEEQELRGLLRQEGWLPGEAQGALISIPRVWSQPFIDPAVRATILHHELSHGEYFTDGVYAAFTKRFWQTCLSEDERARFRSFLGREGYDTGQEDLMMNEMQAYLMHTPDPRFFNARAVAISEDRLARLRMAFRADMPGGWLRDETPAVLTPAAATPARVPRRRRRATAAGCQRRGPVVTTSASAAKRTLCRRAASSAALSARR